MKKLSLLLMMVVLMSMSALAAKHQFRTVEGDPFNTQIYTLPNGLQVFMSVNKAQPRIQTYIAVRVGGKNDPAETTGLAHYFEHLMFKGTEKFGTSDYAKEKPMLDRIEQLFETYRHTTDSVERRRIYREIDSVSYEASKIAIPNEYDKLMSTIGANGTNAYTSYDVTCYVEDIPSNQIENWAKIQADRFEHPVIRGFHTELETIYEEKNMSLTQDNRKVYEKLLAALYPSHPYGTQTVLGTQENLKNPSITNVKNYHKQWYVPNNMAICLSGDFDPDNMVDIIEKYFGHLKPNYKLNRPALPNEKPITEPIDIEILGPEAENISLVWRTPEAANLDNLVLGVLDNVMNNGRTGIIDVNVNLPQITLGASAYTLGMADAGAYVMSARPKGGQTLDDVRAILLEQLAKLRNGEFTDELVEAVKANMKLSIQNALTSNDSRADQYVNAFVNGIDWADEVADLKRIDEITKADIVAVANKYLGDNAYVAIYKREGTDPTELKLAKPELTPIVMNRDMASDFLTEIQNSEVEPIEPVFADYNRDLQKYKAKSGVEVVYIPNTVNDLSELIYYYKVGSYHDKLLAYAGDLFGFVRTPDMSPEQIKNEFYKLACNARFSVRGEYTFAIITGLDENLGKAAKLFEKILANATLDKEAYDAYIDRVEKSRANQKLSQGSNFSRLASYVRYGEKNAANDIISVDELRTMDPQKFIEALRHLNDYEQTVLYWGKESAKDVVKLVNKTHPLAKKPIKPSTEPVYPMVHPTETIFYIAPYEAKQTYMTGFSNRGDKFDAAKEPVMSLYDEYFGGSMNAIVFQEMRESRSLAYSAGAGFATPSRSDREYSYVSQIATQNDKLIDAIAAFDEIINDMPRSEAAFALAKEALDARIRTSRNVNDELAFAYISDRDLGYDHDPNREVFEFLPKATLDDLVKFQQENVKGRTYHYGILAKPENIDIEALSKLGKVVILTQEQIFGY